MPNVKPMVIAIWCGIGKPKNLNEYLNPLVNEINDIMDTGVLINEYRLDIKHISFICDSPARSDLKGSFHYSSLLSSKKV